jgi:hypothetical protein
MSKNLVTFSGGADSALLVYKLLTETKDENTLVVFCGEKSSKTGLGWVLNRQSLLNMQPLLKELKTYGDFKIIYHIVRPESVKTMMDDMWAPYAVNKYGPELNAGNYDRLVCAVGFEQNNGKFMKSYEQRGVKPYFEAKHMFDSSNIRGELWYPFITNDFYSNYNRWHLHTHLPKILMDKSISCAKSSSCGTCGKCLYDNKVRQCIADGWTAQDLQNWTEERSQYYGGGNGRDAPIIYWIHAETGVKRTQINPGLLAKDKNYKFDIYDKDSFDRWYDTVEYTVPTDWKIVQWGLTKDDWKPPVSLISV